MSEKALAELTATVTALPYMERVDLLNSLAQSLYQGKVWDIQLAEQEKNKRIQRRIAALDKYTGCMGGLWADEDPVEYQRRLREDREIG